MRTGSVPRKLVLPDGELRRFHLPDEPPVPVPGRRAWRAKAVGAVGAWLLFSFVCVHWSEGRLGPRSWLEGTLGWLAALRVEAPQPAAPTRPRLTVPAEPARVEDQVAIVSQPSLTSAPRPPLSRHVGSFDALLEPAEGPPLGSPGPSLGLLDQGVLQPGDARDDALAIGEAQEVYAGPSCERAKLRFKPSFLADAEDAASLALLGEARRYAHCKPDLMSLRLCALVHRGEAIGVTVQSEPPNRRVSTCAAIVAKTLHYPKQKRPQLLRTEIYFK